MGRDQVITIKQTTRILWSALLVVAAAVVVRAAATGGARAKNVLMFLGDGMAAFIPPPYEEDPKRTRLSFENFPTLGLAETGCVDPNPLIADSACLATGYLCGVKNNPGTIGVTASVSRKDCSASIVEANQVKSIAAWALADGRDAGIVTTERVTQATPAATYASVADDTWENDAVVSREGLNTSICLDIAHQLVHSYPGNEFKVILGGGRQEFEPVYVGYKEGGAGQRADGRNLIQEWQSDKQSRNASYKWVWGKGELLLASGDLPQYLLGLFDGNHLPYHMAANGTDIPNLTELTETAIRMLSRNEKGFFLLVESGRIDHAHHYGHIEYAIDETTQFSAAVQRATELLSEDDSLIVVTAEHGHDLETAYRGSGRLGTHPANSTNYVEVYARGPQHALFSGIYEQSHIPHLMAYAANIVPGKPGLRGGTDDAAHSSATLHNSLLYIFTVVFVCGLLIKLK